MLRAAVLFSLVLTVAACGGGGGGNSNGNGNGNGNPASNLTLTVTSSNINFSAFGPAFQQPNNSIVLGDVTGTGSGTLYVLISSSDLSVVNVGNVQIAGNSGSAAVIPGNPKTVGVGTHAATITIRACLDDPTCGRNQVNGSPKTISVNYTISGTMSNVQSLSFTFGNGAVAADFTRALTVNQYPVAGWTATSDIPFLSVTPGTGGTSLSTAATVNIDQTLLADYEGGTWTGNLHIQPNTVFAGLDLPISVNVTRTRVNTVAPHVAESGRVDEVIIRGENFNNFTPTGVKFGGTDATNFSVISNTEIHATHPALAAGSYTVHLVNGQGVDNTQAVLAVVDPVNFSAEGINFPDGPGVNITGMLYDAERTALLVQYLYSDTSTHRLARFAHTASGWQFTGSKPTPYGSAIAMSIDGQRIYLARLGAFDELNPVSLDVTRSVTNNNLEGSGGIAVSNDGRAIIHNYSSCCTGSFSELYYSPLRRELGQVMPPPPGSFGVRAGPVAGSGDGSVVLMTDADVNRTLRYVSGSTQAEQFASSRPLSSRTQVNRRGTLFTTENGTALNASLALIGNVPSGVSALTVAPESPLVYGFNTDHTVRVFDTSASVVNGNLAEILPAITLAADPTDGISTDVYVMRVSSDGRTLFIGGRGRLVVQPLP
jgi:hypothetical protein